jgi:tripartite-type tricarboxylate transporter receptor subunit TctC
LRALAITGETRWFDMPDVPTLKESGFPDLVSETFQGMYAPAGTPDDIVKRVARETLAVVQDPEITAKLRDVGFEVRAAGPEGLAARVAKEVPMWREVIVKSKMELQ